jgi:hypothetical protein
MGMLPKSDWLQLDKELRGELKAVLNIPVRATNRYLYGSAAAGCCNIPLAGEVSDVMLADGAFKLLTSADLRVVELASAHLRETVFSRISRSPTSADLGAYLSGCAEGDFYDTTAPLRNVWTLARLASTRAGLEWKFDSGQLPLPTVTRGGATVTPALRRKFAATIRGTFLAERDKELRDLPDQGKAMSCVAMSKASHSFIRTGDHVTFADWRFIHRARLDVLPLNGCRPWAADRGDMRSAACRRCGYERETLPHVLQHCMRQSRMILDRHNRIVNRLKKAAQFRHTILAENQEFGVAGLRPDLIIRQGGSVTIIDVVVPFPNQPEELDSAVALKIAKYQPLAKHLRRSYPKVTIAPFVVGSLGVWHPGNDALLNKLGTRSYGHLFRLLCVRLVRSACGMCVAMRWTAPPHQEMPSMQTEETLTPT